MKTITFTYTKADGNVTSRTLMGYTEPTAFYEGTDVSNISPTAQAEYAVAADKLHTKYLSALASLRNEFDINHSYRRFTASKVTDISVEHI